MDFNYNFYCSYEINRLVMSKSVQRITGIMLLLMQEQV